MEISIILQQRLAAQSAQAFGDYLLNEFIEDAKKRNPDVTNERMLRQLARPKYAEAIKALNAELESLRIINRRNDA